MQLINRTTAPGDAFKRERFVQAGKSPTASRARIRSLLAHVLSPGDADGVERIRFRASERILLDFELTVPRG
jgi:hypothetical protein